MLELYQYYYESNQEVDIDKIVEYYKNQSFINILLKKVKNDVLVNGKINCRKLVNLNVVFPVSNIIRTIFNIIIHVNLTNLY